MLGARSNGGTGLRIEIEGAVQGIGFRPWVYTLAREAALGGRVWNESGNVTIEAFGDAETLGAFVDRLARPPMVAARIHALRCRAIPAETVASFEIVDSRVSAARRPSIPPDLATCADCRREVADPNDRRHGYPFINCTHCGPRYTICEDVPYDRAWTTMADFRMCDACRTEYENPADRRFHAQPNACPTCGPRLSLVDDTGTELPGDALAEAARLLRDGAIVAVKGLGGYHLACDATDADTVAKLRARKHRDAKPFAVMVADLHAAHRLAELTIEDCDLLVQPSRPIVLLPRRCDARSGVALEVSPGNALVGLMLPYTPLHELLLAAVGRPLVMTSGNRSDEPMAYEDDDAVVRLGAGGRSGGGEATRHGDDDAPARVADGGRCGEGEAHAAHHSAGDGGCTDSDGRAGIADAFLRHDRRIANRCDDSVARIIAGRAVVLRRGRGWVPASLRVSREIPRPVLGCGGHLKNTFCLVSGGLAWLGPHVGDLETHEACADFESMVERFARFVGIEPSFFAHDLHPDYFTTRWATDREHGGRIAVQHHHAHAVSAMAEHGVDGPVIALAWDGTGYGTDGTAWGGELLVADASGYRRFGTLRTIALAGGDAAIREVWRIALAVLDDAFDGDPPLERLRLFERIDTRRVDTVRRMIANDLRSPRARGVGRYFDAFGALALAVPESRFEGDVAMRLAFAADASERRAYPFDVIEEHASAGSIGAEVEEAAGGDGPLVTGGSRAGRDVGQRREAAAAGPSPSRLLKNPGPSPRAGLRAEGSEPRAGAATNRKRRHSGAMSSFRRERRAGTAANASGPDTGARRLARVLRQPAMLQIDLRPAVRGAVVDLIDGKVASTVSGRFHATLAAAATVLVAQARSELGPLPVVLTGGCFQNARLTEDVASALAPAHRVLLHGEIPPNDGGIALGQAVVAGAVLRGEPSALGGECERPRVEVD